MPEPAIRCQALRKVYDGGVEALRGLDLEIAPGECFGLLGPNGAGKTTTIEILEGLLEPTGGEVALFGRRWRTDRAWLRERIGATLQEARFLEKLTVRETLRLFGSLYARERDPERLLEEVQLVEKARARVETLSGGQRQRLALACALVGSPELLFLDEPTAALDPQSRRYIWDLVRKARAQGSTILLTTHNMDEAERLCDRVAIVDHGRAIRVGTPPQLIAELEGEHVIELAIEGAAPLDGAPLADLPGVRATSFSGGTATIVVTAVHLTLPILLQRLEAQGRVLSRLVTRHATLEDVFVALTGRHLRDE